MFASGDPYRQTGIDWNVYYPRKPELGELRRLLNQSQLVDNLAINYLRPVFFSYHDFSLLKVSRTATDYIGASADQVIAAGAPGILNAIQPSQRSKILNNSLALAAEFQAPASQVAKKMVSNYVNLKVNFPNRPARRVLFQFFPVVFAEDGQPLIGMMLMHDIGAYMHPDVWWCRYSSGDTIRYYDPETDTLSNKDIISTREIEVLKLVREGMTSKQIADELFVSNNTVDNHRRNMLKRTGAVDTSALIHIAELTNML